MLARFLNKNPRDYLQYVYRQGYTNLLIRSNLVDSHFIAYAFHWQSDSHL